MTAEGWGPFRMGSTRKYVIAIFRATFSNEMTFIAAWGSRERAAVKSPIP